MTSKEIRQQFFDFFSSKGHKIVPSAPIVNKNDPTLMFTNAGMNQFKDYFLGNGQPDTRRIADTQKCLRVSGKHNDLEEVGIDSYHHTMFEMLGNWSFGDYFKKEAIEWAWELLTEVYQLPKDRLYVSVFEGDNSDNLKPDEEAADIWANYVDRDRILYFDRKDNFWEMGETGPCGPCSEIHIDLRSEIDRDKIDGKTLVNADDPLVVEIWNLVFIQFNRLANGSLEELPESHVDTGMGFERLCMAIQQTQSNYDTDVFKPYIEWLENETNKKYEGSYSLQAKKDIAFRVIVDHIRAVAFTIADGQLPSNTGAGYVIRRILRRAVRYYYTFLEVKEPLLYRMIPLLSSSFKDVFPELKAQQTFVEKIILEEEKSFLNTLESGLKRLSQIKVNNNTLDGQIAFELYDTYGFPIDLTRLIGQDSGWIVDEQGFKNALEAQKARSRNDAKKELGDWIVVNENGSVEFVGYDHDNVGSSRILKLRTVKEKDKEVYQIVLDKTPFYAESGGQVGDVGTLRSENEEIKIYNTQKENDLIIHYADKFPENINTSFVAEINVSRRRSIENNHTATHILHAALREVLGKHVQQKGSLVNDRQLRFDFSHFEKMSKDEIKNVEAIANQKIRENIALEENRSISIHQAKKAGAMMLFGEKYGDQVRMITFDQNFSRELCGGCHTSSTGTLGLIKIKSESAIAAGVRRIEALTGKEAMAFVDQKIDELSNIKALFKAPKNLSGQIDKLISDNKVLTKEIEKINSERTLKLKDGLIERAIKTEKGYNIITQILYDIDVENAKTLAYSIEQSVDDLILLFGIKNQNKANLLVLISKNLVSEQIHAGKIIKVIAKEIQGGGGGQGFFATAGGKNPDGIESAIKLFLTLLN